MVILMIKIGSIHSIDLDNRLITLKNKNKIEYFYLQNGLIKKFQRYLEKKVFVEFDCNGEGDIFNNVYARKINFFIRIFRNTPHNREVFYDLTVIRSGVKDLLFNQNNIMFLDLEMTMQSFESPKDFKSEIIQAGYLITDKLGNDLERKNYYIKPTLFPKLNKRTLKFLSLNEEDINNGISFNEFYNIFSDTLKKYNNPSIVVWGKNDILALKACYEINALEPLKPNYINLLQVHKNYFNLKNDLGLFDAYKKYTGEDLNQEHDALVDAFMTKNVFFEFKKQAAR
jgi:sporulation inhibitor KapD